jgi:hypothetical protein
VTSWTWWLLPLSSELTREDLLDLTDLDRKDQIMALIGQRPVPAPPPAHAMLRHVLGAGPEPTPAPGADDLRSWADSHGREHLDLLATVSTLSAEQRARLQVGLQGCVPGSVPQVRADLEALALGTNTSAPDLHAWLLRTHDERTRRPGRLVLVRTQYREGFLSPHTRASLEIHRHGALVLLPRALEPLLKEWRSADGTGGCTYALLRPSDSPAVLEVLDRLVQESSSTPAQLLPVARALV